MLLMGKSTISMAIFHWYVSSPEGKASRKDCKKHILEITSKGGVHWVIRRGLGCDYVLPM